jgi:hypothetical protein
MQPPEQMVDLLAHVELGQDTTKAIELFQLDADLYPGSPQAYKATIARLRAKKEK